MNRSIVRVPERLGEALDEAPLTVFDFQRGLLIVWNGSVSFNVYDLTGNCLAHWSVSTPNGTPLTEREARASIERRLTDDPEDDYNLDYLIC